MPKYGRSYVFYDRWLFWIIWMIKLGWVISHFFLDFIFHTYSFIVLMHEWQSSMSIVRKIKKNSSNQKYESKLLTGGAMVVDCVSCVLESETYRITWLPSWPLWSLGSLQTTQQLRHLKHAGRRHVCVNICLCVTAHLFTQLPRRTRRPWFTPVSLRKTHKKNTHKRRWAGATLKYLPPKWRWFNR